MVSPEDPVVGEGNTPIKVHGVMALSSSFTDVETFKPSIN